MCFPYLSNESSAVADSNRFSAFDKTSSICSSVERACLFRNEPRERFAEPDEELWLPESRSGIDGVLPSSLSLGSSLSAL